MSEEIRKETEIKENSAAKTNRKLKIALIAAVAVIVIAGAVFAVSAAKGGNDKKSDAEINSQQQIPQDVIGEEAALEIAVKEAGVKESEVTNSYVELEADDGIAKYEVEFYTGNTEYTFEIDAQSGNILSYEKENADGSYSTDNSKVNISSDEAKETALKKAGVKSADVYDMDIELEHGTYEVSFDASGIEYEVTVDADTGNVIHFTNEYDR